MKFIKWFLFGFLILFSLSSVTITPIAWLGVAVLAFGLFHLFQNKKGASRKKRPGWFIATGFIFCFIVGVAFTEPSEPSASETENENQVVKNEEIKKEEKVQEEQTGNDDANQENQKAASSSSHSKSSSEGKPSTKKPTETSGTTNQIPVTLVRVVDGDTIKIMYKGEEKNVRYLLIDTPETSHPRLGKQPFGPEAKTRNEELIKSGKLTIEFDVGERIDKYGRLLAYVYAGGKSVQETLLKEGLARVAYVYPPNTRHLDRFKAAEKIAKDKKIGIWSIENYATDSGFNGGSSTSNKSNSSSATKPNSSSTNSGTENFKNCTELRKVYPDGVSKDHPAYQSKIDRDKDGWACER